jgi:hypothetical protein
MKHFEKRRPRGRDLADREALRGGVDGLGVQVGAGDAEVRLVADGWRGAQVGGLADAFEDGGQRRSCLGR